MPRSHNDRLPPYHVEDYLKLIEELHEAERLQRVLYHQLKGKKGYIAQEDLDFYLKAQDVCFELMKQMETIITSMREDK